MGNYNFEEDSNSLGETIRIDHINDEIQKHKYIDKKTDDDFFETKANEEQSQQVRQVRKRKSIESEYKRNTKNEKGLFGSMGFLIFAIVLGVIMFFVVFYAVFASINDTAGKIATDNASDNQLNNSSSDQDKNITSADLSDFTGLIEDLPSADEISFYDILNNKKVYVNYDDETEILDENNNEVSLVSLKKGSIVKVYIDEEKNSAKKIDFSSEAWSKKGLTNVLIDNDTYTIKTDDKNYKFSENSIFMYGENSINASDVDKSDILTLNGYEDNVWCVSVEEYHGFISVKNKENIENGTIKVDDLEVMDLNDFNKYSVSPGTHKVVINGSNIETFKADIFVETSKEYEIDLSDTQEKTGVISVNVNVDGYKLLINNEEVFDTSKPIVLNQGEYTVEVLKEGYESYKETVSLDKPSIKINAVLKEKVKTGKLTIASQPSSAFVYLDGEYIGVTPILKEVTYGEHRIEVKKDGYISIDTPAYVKSADEYLNIVLNPANE